MLVSQTAGIGREECWSVKIAGYVGSRFGRYIGQSNGWGSGVGREVCWLVKTAGIGREVCWLVIQLG